MTVNRHREACIVRGRRVVLNGGIMPASVHIRDGIISRIGEWEDIDSTQEIFDADTDAILPGVVDIHAHINEPGRAEWEGFDSPLERRRPEELQRWSICL